MDCKRKLEDLTPRELAEQVTLCHEHFRRCRRALAGDLAVEPVTLFMDEALGDSDDLELFYECLKAGNDGKE